MVKTHLPNISVRAAGSAFRLPHIRRGKKKKIENEKIAVAAHTHTHRTQRSQGSKKNCGNVEMNVPTAPTPNKHLNIPDLRFEKVFKKALHRELAPSSSLSRKAGAITKVVVRDVLLMPLLQSFVLSLALMGVKEWLSHIRLKGRTLGDRIRQRLFPI
ncbi:BCE_3a_G0018860.mRNA.1.CDS.1 [Saccharomyces cerevisiae]|nr:BCE_3a_G0018860.mRNA.1.CDS.1 [Saccharomyces cerevisiae]CAI7168776.1 BCE_3a_G0018860.mRNA.1.CDS.1 [Saccharomyces cerevisiae]